MIDVRHLLACTYVVSGATSLIGFWLNQPFGAFGLFLIGANSIFVLLLHRR